MKKVATIFIFLTVLSLFSAQPAISPWKGAPMKLDGKLNDAGWQSATPYSDFVPTEASGKKQAEVTTVFRICADQDYLYVGVECEEPRMKELDMQGGIWISDGVEFFFCPSGKDDEFYQFRVNANGPTYAMFYAECGATRPDAYAPVWDHAVNLRSDGWSIEMRIPWHAFYMTGTNAWSGTWRMNIARNRRLARQDLTWSPLRDNFLDSKYYRSMSGFPARKPSADIAIREASMQGTRHIQNKYTGQLSIAVTASKAIDCTIQCMKKDEKPLKQNVSLKAGLNKLLIPEISFPEQGHHEIQVQLRQETNILAERFCYVPVSYEPIHVNLAKPGYRNTFYPGQSSDQIAGSIIVSDAEIKEVDLALDERPPLRMRIDNGKCDFSLKTPGLSDGRHLLTLSVPGNKELEQRIPVQKFSSNPTGHTGAWIENGWLIVNGEPKFPRLIYAHYYHGGKALDAKTDADDLGLSGKDRDLRRVIEPKRLITDIEFREATRDVKPCQQMYDKMRQTIEKFRNQDFEFYFFADEPECREVSPVYLKYMYDFVKELDPWHPMQISTREPARYLDCADIIVPHPYTGPMFDGKGGRFLTVPVSRIRDYARTIANANRPDKIAGMMNQFFSYKMNSVYADYPTFEELEAQTFSSLANSVHFFYPYAYHDIGDRPVLYEGLRYIMTSLRALSPLTLLSECHTLASSNPDETDCALLTHRKDALLLVVNVMPKAVSVTIDDARLAQFPSWHRFREKGAPLPGKEKSLSFQLAPYQCIICTTRPMGTELPTREETLQKIAALEKERLSRPSLLIDKGHLIEINCSNMPRNTVGLQNKLFDGTRDTFAWDNAETRNKPAFMELSFTQGLTPTFRKLRLYGTPLSRDIRVSIRKRGEWITLAPEEIHSSEYGIEFCYPEAYRTIRMRIDFPHIPNQIIELYEIELE